MWRQFGVIVVVIAFKVQGLLGSCYPGGVSLFVLTSGGVAWGSRAHFTCDTARFSQVLVLFEQTYHTK